MTYKIQIDDLIRDASPEETAQIEAQIAADLAVEESRKTKRDAVLNKLGLTADEVIALIS
jgi:hypothetical protein